MDKAEINSLKEYYSMNNFQIKNFIFTIVWIVINIFASIIFYRDGIIDEDPEFSLLTQLLFIMFWGPGFLLIFYLYINK